MNPRALLPALLLTASACAFDSSEPPLSTPIMPLAAGTEWRYLQTDSVEIGPPTGLIPWHETIRVSRDTTIDGRRWAVVENGALLVHGLFDDPIYLQNRQDGLYEQEVGTLPGFPVTGLDLSFQIFKYPAKRGDRFSAFPVTTVTATDTTIHVPAGTFSTVRYDVGDYTTHFVAPGVGIVKTVAGLLEELDASGQVVGRRRLVYELEGFTLR